MSERINRILYDYEIYISIAKIPQVFPSNKGLCYLFHSREGKLIGSVGMLPLNGNSAVRANLCSVPGIERDRNVAFKSKPSDNLLDCLNQCISIFQEEASANGVNLIFSYNQISTKSL